eukprot:871472-Pelagomonas_calceolata.AAC.2
MVFWPSLSRSWHSCSAVGSSDLRVCRCTEAAGLAWLFLGDAHVLLCCWGVPGGAPAAAASTALAHVDAPATQARQPEQ